MILLFVGGMIVLMVRTNSGFTYPGYIIYLSALYTFYTMITAVVNVVKFRKLGSPILSAAKILNFISAMMSILGLQTAMISRFSENGDNISQEKLKDVDFIPLLIECIRNKDLSKPIKLLLSERAKTKSSADANPLNINSIYRELLFLNLTEN